MRTVTPRLKVTDTALGLGTVAALILMEDGGVALVRNDDDARDVMRGMGMRPCCVEDRISVSHGGPILCHH